MHAVKGCMVAQRLPPPQDLLITERLLAALKFKRAPKHGVMRRLYTLVACRRLLVNEAASTFCTQHKRCETTC
jgi:hypothetical protein